MNGRGWYQNSILGICIICLIVIVFLATLLPTQQAHLQQAQTVYNGPLVFSAYFSGPSESRLSFITESGSPVRDVAPSDTDNRSPDFSPDGTKLIFSRQVSEDTCHIFMVHGTGGEPQQLTSQAGICDGDPRFSFDGTTIFFSSNRANPFSSIKRPYRMNRDGSNVQEIGNFSNPCVAAGSFANGRVVLYGACDDPDTAPYDESNIFAFDLDSSNITKLSVGNFFNDQLDISPDGTGLTFSCMPAQSTGFLPIPKKSLIYLAAIDYGTLSEPRICRMDSDGSNAEIVTPVAGSHSQLYPKWSPDGEFIYYYQVEYDGDGYITDLKIIKNTASGNGPEVLPISLNDTYTYAVQPLTLTPVITSGEQAQLILDLQTGNNATFDTVTQLTDYYGGINPASIAIISTPKHGEASINAGTGVISYSLRQMLGASTDELTFTVCSVAHPQLCSNHVLGIRFAPGTPNSGRQLIRNNPSIVFVAALATGGAVYYLLRRAKSTSKQS